MKINVTVIANCNDALVFVNRKNHAYTLPVGEQDEGNENLTQAAVRILYEKANILVRSDDLYAIAVYSYSGVNFVFYVDLEVEHLESTKNTKLISYKRLPVLSSEQEMIIKNAFETIVNGKVKFLCL